MKIAIVIHEYPPIGGGAATAAKATAKAMVELGHEVLVITAGGRGLGVSESHDGVRVERLPSIRLRDLAPSAVELLSFCASARVLLRRRLRQFAADGVLVYFAVPAGAFAVPAARALGIPVIVSLRGSDVPGFADGRLDGPLGRLVHPIIKRTLRRASAVSPNSQVLEDLMARLMPELAGAMRQVRNGVDRSLIASHTARSLGDELVIVQLGQLIRRKRVSMVLRAVASLAKKGLGVRFLVIGDGPLRTELEGEAASLGIAALVRFAGRMPRTDVPAALRSSDVFAMASAAEGMSNAVMEAMAAGLAIVTTRNGSDDIVTRADAGLVVDVDDEAAFQSRLEELCTQPQLREQLAQNGLEYASTMTWERCASRYIELFHELVQPADQVLGRSGK